MESKAGGEKESRRESMHTHMQLPQNLQHNLQHEKKIGKLYHWMIKDYSQSNSYFF